MLHDRAGRRAVVTEVPYGIDRGRSPLPWRVNVTVAKGCEIGVSVLAVTKNGHTLNRYDSLPSTREMNADRRVIRAVKKKIGYSATSLLCVRFGGEECVAARRVAM